MALGNLFPILEAGRGPKIKWNHPNWNISFCGRYWTLWRRKPKKKKKNHAERSSTHLEEHTSQRGYRAYGPNHDGFFALIGSPLGHCVTRMLTEHSKEPGNRLIEKAIILRVDDEHNLEESQPSRNVIFVLSDRREWDGAGDPGEVRGGGQTFGMEFLGNRNLEYSSFTILRT